MDDLSTEPRLSKRFALRPFRRRDADEMLEAVSASHPELNEWLPWARIGYLPVVCQPMLPSESANTAFRAT